jgi:hypothetical protein
LKGRGAVRDGECEILFGAQWSLAMSRQIVPLNGASANAPHVQRSSSGSSGLLRVHQNLIIDKGLRATGHQLVPFEDVQCRVPTSSRGSLITVAGSNPAPATKKYEC